MVVFTFRDTNRARIIYTFIKGILTDLGSRSNLYEFKISTAIKTVLGYTLITYNCFQMLTILKHPLAQGSSIPPKFKVYETCVRIRIFSKLSYVCTVIIIRQLIYFSQFAKQESPTSSTFGEKFERFLQFLNALPFNIQKP